jgi:hypothetical protein
VAAVDTRTSETTVAGFNAQVIPDAGVVARATPHERLRLHDVVTLAVALAAADGGIPPDQRQP